MGVPYPTPSWAGVLSTAGGVVFTGDNEGNFLALDSRTGKNLYRHQIGAPVYAAPMTYMLDGQSIRRASCWNHVDGVCAGGERVVSGLAALQPRFRPTGRSDAGRPWRRHARSGRSANMRQRRQSDELEDQAAHDPRNQLKRNRCRNADERHERDKN